VAVAKQSEVRVPVVELIRQVGISEHTQYPWKQQSQAAVTKSKRSSKVVTLDQTRVQDLFSVNVLYLQWTPLDDLSKFRRRS
jgi:hypothetical protein